MARTVNEIEENILTKQQELLPQLTDSSQSNTTIWRLWIKLISYAFHLLEQLWDQFKAEVDEKIATRRLGTPDWYVTVAREFQLDVFPREDLASGAVYETIDPSKQIIARASFKEGGDTLTLKVAKETTETDQNGNTVVKLIALSSSPFIQTQDGEEEEEDDDNPTNGNDEQPLENPNGSELEQFQAYLDKIKFAGTKVRAISLEADILEYNAIVLYDPILNPENVEKNIKNAVNQFLRNIPFSGLLYRNQLEQAIIAVEGVSDVKITLLKAIQGANEYPINYVYEAQAGYLNAPDDNSNITLVTNPLDVNADA